jgi:hypothetical protein
LGLAWTILASSFQHLSTKRPKTIENYLIVFNIFQALRRS